jgi:hypothetical protein
MKLRWPSLAFGAALSATVVCQQVALSRDNLRLAEIRRLEAQTRRRTASANTALEKLEKARAEAAAAAVSGSGSDLLELLQKVNHLKRWIDAHRSAQIPELRYAYDGEWFTAVGDPLPVGPPGKSSRPDGEYAWAYVMLRSEAVMHAGKLMLYALDRFAEDNAGELPKDVGELAPYFPDSHVDAALFERYEMMSSGKLTELPSEAPLFGEKPEAAADEPAGMGATGAKIFGKGGLVTGENPHIGPIFAGDTTITEPLQAGENPLELSSALSVAKSLRSYRLANRGASPPSYAAVLSYAVDEDAKQRLTRLAELEASATVQDVGH